MADEQEALIAFHQRLLDDAVAAPPPYPAQRFAGRGIVICAGGARLFTCAYVLVEVLQDLLGCRLPIQVWHLGPAEMGPPMRAILEEKGVEVVDAFDVRRQFPMRTLGGWELKPYALAHCRFEEVLLLDADNVPVRDPAFLFEVAEYRATGAVFWPDVVALGEDNPIWKICRVAFRPVASLDSGQLLLDKRRCWPALMLALQINAHSDFLYRFIYGDKDSYLLAWLRLGQTFAMPQQRAKRLPGVLCQHDFAGDLLFQHRTRTKWLLIGDNPRIPGFRHEDFCLAALERLGAIWRGRIFQPPLPRSPAVLAAEAALAGRSFRLSLVASHPLELQLLSGNRIGRGGSTARRVWHVEEDPGGLVLVLGLEELVSARLTCGPDGVWRGRELVGQRMEIELHPLPPGQGSAAEGHGSASHDARPWRSWRYRSLESGDGLD